MKNLFKLFGIIALCTIVGFALVACGNGAGGPDPGTDPCVECGEYPCECTDPGTDPCVECGEYPCECPGPVLCPACGQETCITEPPALPAGSAAVPEGAVWLGCWAHNIDDGMVRWDQIRWEISQELRQRIVDGELNSLWLIVDPDEIDPELFAENRGGLSSVLMIINSPAGWKQQGRPHYHRTTIPIEEIRETDNLLKWYLDWTPDFDLINPAAPWMQIFIQHSGAGGAMPNVAPVAAFLAPRTPEDPPPPDRTPVNTIITVAGVEQIVTVTGRSGAVSRIVDDVNETRVIGFQYGEKTGGHRGHYAWFGVELGSYRLSDFEKIRFTFEGVAGGSRRLALIASATEFTASLAEHPTGGSNLSYPLGSSHGYLAAGQVTRGMRAETIQGVSPPETVELLISGDNQNANPADFTGSVYLSIYEHTGDTNVFRITNIELVLAQLCVTCGVQPCECCTFGAPCGCDAAIQAAQGIVQGHQFVAIPQASAGTQTAAIAVLEQVIAGLSGMYGVVPTVVPGTFQAAVAGTSGSPNGTPGSFTFTVNLNRGHGTQLTTTQQSVIITATVFALCADCGEDPCVCVIIFDMRDHAAAISAHPTGTSNLPLTGGWLSGHNQASGTTATTADPLTITLEGRGGVGQVLRFRPEQNQNVFVPTGTYRFEYAGIFSVPGAVPRIRFEGGTPTGLTLTIDGSASDASGVFSHSVTMTGAQALQIGVTGTTTGISLSTGGGNAVNITYTHLRIIKLD